MSTPSGSSYDGTALSGVSRSPKQSFRLTRLVSKAAGFRPLRSMFVLQLCVSSLLMPPTTASPPELAAGIQRVKGAKRQGVRMGNWLTHKQAEDLINAPDPNRLKGKRDRALLAVLIGCGLRRSEAAALTFAHIQQREGRWVIVDLIGKHGRVRSVPMPSWAKVAIDD
jgi:integrase